MEHAITAALRPHCAQSARRRSFCNPARSPYPWAMAGAFVLGLSALSAPAHGLALSCPSAAAGPATALQVATDAAWQFQGSGGWAAASDVYKSPWWYPVGSSRPSPGAWITPADASLLTPSTQQFLFRSPPIQIDSRIELASIQTSMRAAVDNWLDETGVAHSAQPGGAFVATALANKTALNSFTPALDWAHGSNRLIFKVRNREASIALGPMGIYAIFDITANCKAAMPAPVPANAPWALLLAGASVAALAARRGRRATSASHAG